MVSNGPGSTFMKKTAWTKKSFKVAGYQCFSNKLSHLQRKWKRLGKENMVSVCMKSCTQGQACPGVLAFHHIISFQIIGLPAVLPGSGQNNSLWAFSRPTDSDPRRSLTGLLLRFFSPVLERLPLPLPPHADLTCKDFDGKMQLTHSMVPLLLPLNRRYIHLSSQSTPGLPQQRPSVLRVCLVLRLGAHQALATAFPLSVAFPWRIKSNNQKHLYSAWGEFCHSWLVIVCLWYPEVVLLLDCCCCCF